MRLTRFVHAVRTSLWVVPLLCVLAGVLIALGTLWLDRRSGYTLVPQSVTGTPSDAQTTLSVFATAMLSLTSLVLTVTLVVVQLAMGQFSPRIVAALLSDRFSQLAIGLFGATFVVAVLTLREIRGSDTGTVPGLSVLLTHLLMVASLVTLILFVHHSGQIMRATGLIDLVGDRTRDLIESSFPAAPRPATGPDADLTWSPRGSRAASSGSTAPGWSPPRAAPTASSNWCPSSATSCRAGHRCSACTPAPGGRGTSPGRPRGCGPRRSRGWSSWARARAHGGRRLRAAQARRRRGAVDRSAVQRPDDDPAGAAPAARPAAPARGAPAPRRRAPGRGRRGPAGRAHAVLGRLRAAGLRRDPAGRRDLAAGDPPAVRGAAGPQERRPARPAGPARPPAAAADRRRPPGLRGRGGHRRRAHARRRGHRVGADVTTAVRLDRGTPDADVRQSRSGRSSPAAGGCASCTRPVANPREVVDRGPHPIHQPAAGVRQRRARLVPVPASG